MVDLLGPADAGASPTHATTSDVTAPVSGDTWHFDCIGGVAGTATPVVSKWLNRLNQQLRAAIRSAGIPTSNAYDEMLSWAIQSGYANWVGFFAGAANALTGAAPNGPLTIPGGTVVCGQISASTNTGATTFNWAGLGVQNVHRLDGAVLTGGELRTGDFLVMRWDGGNWRIVSPLPLSFSASNAPTIQLNQQTFSTAGAYSWTIPANFAMDSSILVELWGAGQGTVIGVGGQGGSYSRFESYLGFFCNSGDPRGYGGGVVNLQVGQGGLASNNSGQNINGGWSIFGSSGWNNFFATPGGGVALAGNSSAYGDARAPTGQASPVSSFLPVFESGGLASNPAGFAVRGAPAVFAAAGGASWNGVDGTPWSSVLGGSGGANTVNGSSPGGGGGGGRTTGTPSPTVGGAGADGRVKITVIGPYQS